MRHPVELETAETTRRSRKQKASRRQRLSQRGRRLKMESLEERRLLAVAGGLGFDPPPFDASFLEGSAPRNVGVPSFIYNELETGSGSNDSPNTAEFLPLGTGAGQEDTIDVNGQMTFSPGPSQVSTDIDYYAVDLRAGDILDISVSGSGASFAVRYESGGLWFGTRTNTALLYPTGSPLQDAGVAVAAQVVPEDGRYFILTAPTTTSVTYTMGLRVYRPIIEQAPLGSQQKVFLDFDGHLYATNDFASGGIPGFVEIFGLEESLGVLGFTNPNVPQVVNEIIDFTVEETVEQLRTLAQDGSIGSGTNGDFLNTGIGGDYGIVVLNSRDHADPGDTDPLLTRVIIGSETTTGFPPGALFGIAQSIDIGNFRPNEEVLVGLEPHFTAADGYIANGQVQNRNRSQTAAQQMAGTISHELGHSFGMWHTDGDNATPSLGDEGSISLNDHSQALGPDGIFGTADDIVPYFDNDRFSSSLIGGPGEDLLTGTQRLPAGLSHALSTGTVSATISGNVFNDLNGDGRDINEPGLGGVTVFADLSPNGVRDTFEPIAVTDANGNYSLTVPPGMTVNVLALLPNDFRATNPAEVVDSQGNGTGIVHRLANGGETAANFGFALSDSAITGTKFADTNGNGFFDTTESGLEGVYIYLDLDGDDRPDLGEPSAITGSNGSYVINFPGPGTYTVREVVEPGFIQTFPGASAGFEHVVTFNGTDLPSDLNFGNLPSRDYGDAPDSYQTSVATGGPSHGLSEAVGLGALVDRETNGFPSANALGDDSNNLDDEDGVTLISPLGLGGDATFEVVTRNTSGSQSYLQGWIDFDGNQVFDANEQVFTDLALGNGTTELTVSVPTTAAVGATFARFRYSPTTGLGVGGDADVGEVEDYQFEILNQAAIANDDQFNVSRNSLSNTLDVLANDFDTTLNPLTIVQVSSADNGQVNIAGGGRSVLYTPRNGFTGRDVFQYVVRDTFGNEFTATVVVDVNFQSNVPIAVDDTFEVPQNSSNRALNVLDNDVPSIFGGLSIT
ncbi:MAG: GEVED domain-containing protein, partial [Planctomycetota bacterium]